MKDFRRSLDERLVGRLRRSVGEGDDGVILLTTDGGGNVWVAAGAVPPAFIPSQGGTTTITATVIGPASNPALAGVPLTVTARIADAGGTVVRSFPEQSIIDSRGMTLDTNNLLAEACEVLTDRSHAAVGIEHRFVIA